MRVHFLNDFPKMHINRAMDMLSFDVKRHPSGIWCEKKKFQNYFCEYFTKLHMIGGCPSENFDFFAKVAPLLINFYITKSIDAQGVFETESFNTEGGGVL